MTADNLLRQMQVRPGHPEPALDGRAVKWSERGAPAGLKDLLSAVAGLRVRTDVPLRDMGRWKIGGPADFVVEPRNEQALAGALRAIRATGVPYLIIGDGSNLLFDDGGFRGVVVHISRGMSAITIDGDVVTAQAGAWVPSFARRVGSAGLSGAEHTVGIPGTLGGLVVMNGGSQRKGIGDTLIEVVCLDMNGERHVLSRAECAFAYRTSALQSLPLVVVEATFTFVPGDPGKIRHEMIGIMASRRRKFPTKLPNCGSVFVSDPSMYDLVGPPGKAIEQAGLRGRRIGDAQIAHNHGNFIVNLGKASSRDVLALIGLIRQSVHDRTGFWMNCEVRHVSPEGSIQPAHAAL